MCTDAYTLVHVSQWKSLRVSEATHTRLREWMASSGATTVDDALSALLDDTTVHVPVSPVQRARWDHQAAVIGVTTSEFVRMRVEAALTYGFDPSSVDLIADMIRRLERGK